MAEIAVFARKTADHDTICEACERPLDLDKDRHSSSAEDGTFLCAQCHFEFTGERLAADNR